MRKRKYKVYLPINIDKKHKINYTYIENILFVICLGDVKQVIEARNILASKHYCAC